MENHTYKWIGASLMVAAGALYTAERCVAVIAFAIVKSGHAAQGNLTEVQPDYPGFFGNFFVWFLLFVGFLILAYGFPNGRRG